VGDFSTYLRAAFIFGLGMLLHDVLESVTDPIFAVACGTNAPTAVNGAANCRITQDAVTWFAVVVILSLVIMLFARGVTNSGRGV